MLVGISRLSQEVADAADFVPAYDQRGYAKAVKLLTEELEETKAKLAPKSRFQFKPRGGAKGSSGADARRFVPSPNYLGRDDDNDKDIVTAAKDGGSTNPGQGSEQADNVGSLPTFTSGGVSKNYNEEISKCAGKMGPRKPSFSAACDITLSDHSRLHIILPQSASRATSAGQLTNLDGCIVDMSVPTAATGGAGKPFASLALKNISNSLIVAGHVDGSAHITGVKNSVLVIVARQVRIHECENVDLYLHCASHPIIEDCQGMRFAPAPGYHVSCIHPQFNNTFCCDEKCVIQEILSTDHEHKHHRLQKKNHQKQTSGTKWMTSSGSKPSTRPTGVCCRRRSASPRRCGEMSSLVLRDWVSKMS